MLQTPMVALPHMDVPLFTDSIWANIYYCCFDHYTHIHRLTLPSCLSVSLVALVGGGIEPQATLHPTGGSAHFQWPSMTYLSSGRRRPAMAIQLGEKPSNGMREGSQSD